MFLGRPGSLSAEKRGGDDCAYVSLENYRHTLGRRDLLSSPESEVARRGPETGLSLCQQPDLADNPCGHLRRAHRQLRSRENGRSQIQNESEG